MSDEERRVNPQDADLEIQDLKAQAPDPEEAEQVKGGAPSVSEIVISKPTDTASAKLFP